MKPTINDSINANVSEKTETENALTSEYLSETRPGATSDKANKQADETAGKHLAKVTIDTDTEAHDRKNVEQKSKPDSEKGENKVRPAGDAKPNPGGALAGAVGDTQAVASAPPIKVEDTAGLTSHVSHGLAGGADGRPPLARPNRPGASDPGLGAGAAADGAITASPAEAQTLDLGGVGNHGIISAKMDETRKDEKHQKEVRQEAVNLVQGGTLDTNHDGFVTRKELHAAAMSSTREKPQTEADRIKLGMKQDAINYMLDNFDVI